MDVIGATLPAPVCGAGRTEQVAWVSEHRARRSDLYIEQINL
jgi:hypothetical protein